MCVCQWPWALGRRYVVVVMAAVWPNRGGNAKSWRFGGPNVADFWEMSFGVFCHFQAQNGVFLVVFDFWQIIPYFCFIFEESCPFSYKIFPAGHYFLHFNQYLVFCSSFFGCFSIKSLSFETMVYWLYSLFDAWRFWGLLSLEKGVLKKSIWSHCPQMYISFWLVQCWR